MTNHLLGRAMRQLAVTASIGSIAAMSCAGTATAQTASVSLPALPMAEALQRIQAATGKSISYDPDAVSELTSAPVAAARSADAAVRQAVRGTPLVIVREGDDAITITSDVLIVAQRDEAELNLLVRDATTSTRTGQSLRSQPRNTQVLSSRLIKEQQAQTLVDVLRNAGGVSVNTATVQGGISYSVRGFASGGVTNGLPSAASSGFAAGATQPISNVERIEVLKGPDALLAGAANLGGTVNIVTKKPSAQERLYVSAEVGSFGQVRGTIDANNALNADRTLSARIIAAAASADRNYGGYRGNEDYLFAPSLRFKNANTDIVVGASLGNQIFGLTPFVPLNPETNVPFAVPRDRPVLGLADQSTQIQTTQFYGEVTQKAADWLTLVARGQHQKLSLDIRQYSPLVVLAGDGTLLLTNGNTRQAGNSDAIDAYARFAVATGPVGHTLTAGYTYVENDLTALSSNMADFSPFNILTETLPMAPLAPVNSRDYLQNSTQNGFYAQYLAKVWKISVLAGVRHNKFRSSLTTFFRPRTVVDSGSATTPNFGAVFDVTDDLALFGSLSYGYSPTFAPDRAGNRLPDVETKNTEAGVKIDLFDDRLLVNASWFRLRQGVSIITDPTDPRFQIAVPGQQGTGIDVNVTGEILPGWTVQGSLTRTKYRMLTPSAFGNEVVAQPRDQYSLYSAYRHKLGDDLTAGLGAGVYGRSSAAVDSFNSYRVPPARQVDLNAFLTVGRVDVNLGVRNLFDRDNYNITYSPSFIPISEPRNVRLTLGYRFR